MDSSKFTMIDNKGIMIDTVIEESCIYCSKCLAGLNDFNRKMHIETCKVRKLVDANNSLNTNESQLDNYIVVGENCSYCFKSFKDFKSDFNKRLHIKCCKIKKEYYDEKNNMKMNLGGEHCVFCTKPLANLNEFNKRMHIEHCKIRKSIESSGTVTYTTSDGNSPKKLKDENLVKLGIELGENCVYCSKSFVNLSDFNKKLHFEYCKLKKRKIAQLSGNSANLTQNSYTLNCSVESLNTPVNHSNQNNNPDNNTVNFINNQLIASNQNNIESCSDPSQIGKLDLGESCLFCSRSLVNLSNFNKRIHIETCKIKTLKKATSKLRQTSSAKAPRKKSTKKEKNDATNNSMSNIYCQNMNKSLTLELMGTRLPNNNNLTNLVNTEQTQQITNTENSSNLSLNQHHQFIPQSHQIQQAGNNGISQFDSLVATLNQTNPLTLTQIQQQQQQSQSTQNGISQFDTLVASLHHKGTLNLTQMQNHVGGQHQQQQQQPQHTQNGMSQFDTLVASLQNKGSLNLTQLQQHVNNQEPNKSQESQPTQNGITHLDTLVASLHQKGTLNLTQMQQHVNSQMMNQQQINIDPNENKDKSWQIQSETSETNSTSRQSSDAICI